MVKSDKPEVIEQDVFGGKEKAAPGVVGQPNRWKGQVILGRADAKVIYDWYCANMTLENTTDEQALVFGRLGARVLRFEGADE